jgi:hypothetical protein
MNATESASTPQDGKNGCCAVDIRIEKSGDVHIYNCSGPGGGGPGQPPSEPCEPGQVPTGSCIPVVAGAKHKLSREYKLKKQAETVRVPSAIATSIMHMARRFVLGKPPANAMEAAAAPFFEGISRDMLACTVDAFDAIPPNVRDRLFVESLLPDPGQPINEATFVTALAEEIQQRIGVQVFDDPSAGAGERPGKIRVFPPSGEIPPSQVRICRINGLRTANFIPAPALGEYLPTEIHQDCSTLIVNGQPQVVCKVRTADCPGNVLQAAVCARVPEVASGDSVVLEGVNFFSVDTFVRLTDRQTGTIVRDVQAHVWGDVNTPVTEIIDNETVLVNDCRVQDRLTFSVPADLPAGTYFIQVFVPNVTGLPVFGQFLNSDGEFLQVLPPPTARFQVVTERITARQETSPGWIGSDEVGLHAISFALLGDGTFTQLGEDKFKDIRDVDFDTGTSRDITRLIFTHDQPILGMALSMAGFEIDSERALNRLITSRMEFFVDLIKEQAKFAKDAIAALGGVDELKKLGKAGAIVAGIVTGVVIAIDIIVALWAPADPIIRDSFGLSTVDLDILTSASYPAPPPTSFETEGAGDITVNVNKTVPPEKIPLQYRETREYVSSDEDSRYEITYRFNRVA